MKRTISILMAAALLLSLCAPVLAAEGAPAYRLTQVTSCSSDGSSNVYTLVYNGDGLYPDELRSGPVDDSPISTRYYTYDEQGRLTVERAEMKESTSEVTYAYDEAGNLAETVRTTTSTQSSPEGTTENTTVSTVTYAYDENGVSTGNTSVINRKTNDGTDSTETIVLEYSFDESGRRTAEKQTWSDDAGFSDVSEMTYEYAEDGSATTSAGDVYTYDEQGRELTHDYDWGWSQGSYVYTYVPFLKCSGAEATYDGQMQTSFQLEMIFNEESSVSVGYLMDTKEPALTFDENGYLVKADAGDGNYLELTYEQVG